MKIISVGEFKSKFSQILDWIQNGEEVIVSYGRKKEEVAVLIDIKKHRKSARRKFGILEGKSSFKIHKGFEMTDEDVLNA
jgi:antitoxin (DNA-binding transcriptional repressor) of toxin-antitoxin stability system